MPKLVIAAILALLAQAEAAEEPSPAIMAQHLLSFPLDSGITPE
jgi:hypothetical protein